jgi:hypothetical protein
MEKYVNDEVKKIVHLKETGLVIFGKSVLVYLVHLFTIHFVFWLSFNLYSILCVPIGISGFFKSLLYHGSFACNIMFEILNFSKAGVYSMIVHLISGIGTSQWLNYNRKKKEE